MPDLADPSASELLAAETQRAVGGFGGLHLATKIVVVAALIHLLGDLIKAGSVLMNPAQTDYWSSVPLETVAGVLSALGYSLSFFGGAATVEFLFRIWREVVQLRQARER